jgi:hypothetical protein
VLAVVAGGFGGDRDIAVIVRSPVVGWGVVVERS